VEKIKRFTCRLSTGVRAEVESIRFGLPFVPHKAHHGPFVVCRHLEGQVGFIVFEEGVVAGPIFFDQVVFKEKGLFLR